MFWWKSNPNILAAVEIGTTKISVALAELRPDGTLALLGIGEEPSSQIRKSEIVDYEAAARCLHAALLDAERKTDVAINEVYLALSGAHIESTNVRLSIPVETDDHRIGVEHEEELSDLARSHTLPSDYVLIHDLRQHYYLDNGAVVENPSGLSSKRLTAAYHLVYGVTNRLQTPIRCLKELAIDVRNYALSSYATAQAVLDRSKKQMGAIVINCGGGVTDYIAYARGAVQHTGVLSVGGEHLTNDLVFGLKIPYIVAEELKKTHGSVSQDAARRHEEIALPGSYHFQARSFPRESVVKILRARQQEIFQIVLEDLQAQPFWQDFTGTVYLTGGGSQIDGIFPLAREIFPCPVEAARPIPFEGDQQYASRPELTTALGLLLYARQAELETPVPRGWMRWGHSLKKALAALYTL